VTKTTVRRFLLLLLVPLVAGSAACVSSHASEVGPFVRNISARPDGLLVERCEIKYKAVVDHRPYGGKSARLSDGSCSDTTVRLPEGSR